MSDIALPYGLILSNGTGETHVLVPEHDDDTRLRAAHVISGHVGGDLLEAPKTAAWLAEQAEPATLRRHTQQPGDDCMCEDDSWWCHDGDGETGKFWVFRYTDITTAELRGITEQAGEDE